MALVEDLMAPETRSGQIKIHGPEGFEGMRAAGRLAAECLDMLTPYVKPGVVTGELDRLAREFVLDHGALPACLFYPTTWSAMASRASARFAKATSPTST
jgi:methionyl aminopeptidase